MSSLSIPFYLLIPVPLPPSPPPRSHGPKGTAAEGDERSERGRRGEERAAADCGAPEE